MATMVLFWILAALLTVGAVELLVLPLRRTADAAVGASAGSGPAADGETSDLAIYRDQLAEIETDRARGLLSEGELEAARAEIGRRLLARADASLASPSAAATASSAIARPLSPQTVYMAVALLIPCLALGLYAGLGSPSMPSRPLAERLAKAPSAATSIDELIARVEARLRTNPGDGMGWDVVAPVYLRIERFSDAADAYRRAIELLGESPSRLSGFAEATVLARDGLVTEPARQAYARLLELQPGRPEARIGLTLAKEQDGKTAEAHKEYAALLADSPPDAPWRNFVEGRLTALAGRGSDVSSAERDIAGLPQDEQKAMILGMVETLERRLQENGRDVTGWQRLIRSWSVLGRRDKAIQALHDARKALAEDSGALAQLEAFAQSLGLKT